MFTFLGSTLIAQQFPTEPQAPNPAPPDDPSSDRLPNGKSQKDAIAQQQHRDALKDAEQLLALANDVKAELEKAGNFVVPVGTVRKTEEIEKVARRIRNRLKQ